MKIAITGASGFIGRNCLDQWPDALSFGKEKSPTHDITHVGNILDSEFELDFEGVDAVIHLASEVSVRGSLTWPELLETNLGLAKKVYEACVRYKVPIMINVSSSSVYGSVEAPQSESKQPLPLNNYGMSKLAAEQWLNLAAYGGASLGWETSVVNLRLFNAIGKYQRRNMLPSLIMEAYKDKFVIPMFGRMYRAWTPVSFIVNCIEKIITELKIGKSEVYTFNYGSNFSFCQQELIRFFNQELNEIVETTTVEGEYPNEMYKTLPNNFKIQEAIDPKFPTVMDLKSAIRDIIEYQTVN